MQNNNNPPAKTVTLRVSHIRDAAIVLACAAAAYSFLTRPAPQVATTVPVLEHTMPLGNDPATAPASLTSSREKKTEESIHVNEGKLTLGEDELSQKFRGYLKQRIAQVDAAGPVTLAAKRPDASPAASYGRPQGSPVEPLAPVPGDDPVVRSDVKQGNASEYTETGTLHPAPFVDKVAQASIDAATKSALENKVPGVIQIGRQLDGSLMTQAETEQQIRSTLANIPDEWTITYKAPDEKVRLYVFTDTTCPFCHRLHNSMNELLNAGISVHYLLYPRDMGATPSGNLSSTAVNMKNIWCAVDQKAAMNDAFEGYKVAEADCASLPASLKRSPAPVPDHYLAGSMFNVNATPTWLASNGKHDVGFTNAQTMISTLLGN